MKDSSYPSSILPSRPLSKFRFDSNEPIVIQKEIDDKPYQFKLGSGMEMFD